MRKRIMENRKNNCPICGIQMDDNHFTPVSFPGIGEPICCNCKENLGLMFTNFENKPGDNGYIAPDNSERLEVITRRAYIENRLIYFLDCLCQQESKGDIADAEVIKTLKADIEKMYLTIKKGKI
jgi:hypothetical protein